MDVRDRDREFLAVAIEQARIGRSEGGVPIGGEHTTLSPCDMCAGAILLYGIPRVVMGENRTFVGAEDLLRARGVEIVNLDSEECAVLMREFITEHPEIWNEDIGEE